MKFRAARWFSKLTFQKIVEQESRQFLIVRIFEIFSCSFHRETLFFQNLCVFVPLFALEWRWIPFESNCFWQNIFSIDYLKESVRRVWIYFATRIGQKQFCKQEDFLFAEKLEKIGRSSLFESRINLKNLFQPMTLFFFTKNSFSSTWELSRRQRKKKTFHFYEFFSLSTLLIFSLKNDRRFVENAMWKLVGKDFHQEKKRPN